jgi:hypothetical protein
MRAKTKSFALIFVISQEFDLPFLVMLIASIAARVSSAI